MSARTHSTKVFATIVAFSSLFIAGFIGTVVSLSHFRPANAYNDYDFICGWTYGGGYSALSLPYKDRSRLPILWLLHDHAGFSYFNLERNSNSRGLLFDIQRSTYDWREGHGSYSCWRRSSDVLRKWRVAVKHSALPQHVLCRQ